MDKPLYKIGYDRHLKWTATLVGTPTSDDQVVMIDSRESRERAEQAVAECGGRVAAWRPR